MATDYQQYIARMQRDRENLPVFKYKQKILSTIENNSVTLIVGETGSGKTTQIPQYLLEWDHVTPSQKIVCTQPRTVAATSVASRVANELQCELGETVGFHIRLDRKLTDGVTKLEYMTEGVLLRKAMHCAQLDEYRVVLIDEAHERTVNADLLMGFLKNIVARSRSRPAQQGLRVVIMSATLDTQRFKTYFDSPPIIAIPGSLYPIEHHWLSTATKDYVRLCIDTIVAVHNDKNAAVACSTMAITAGTDSDKQQPIASKSGYEPDGHILVFLTGQQEIDLVVTAIKQLAPVNPFYEFALDIHALYASLSSKERQYAFEEPPNPRSTRKCVIATNIAETSLTIANVVYVIDCGLAKQKVYCASKGVEMLGIGGISKASVKQRVGRAGRVKPGKAYHLYTRSGFLAFPNETRAEMLRSGLLSETLSMLALGLSNPLAFDFIDAPNEMTMARALSTLHDLEAVDENARITEIGRQMAKLPVTPNMAKCLLMADTFQCVYEMTVIAAMLENVEKIWRRPKEMEDQKSDFRLKKRAFVHVAGDHLTLLNIFNAYKCKKTHAPHQLRTFCKSLYWDFATLQRTEQIRQQIERILSDITSKERQQPRKHAFAWMDRRCSDYYENLQKCLLTGFFMNVAVQGFGGKFWTFRVRTLDYAQNVKCIEIVDKASCHPTSVYYKNNPRNQRNWVMFHDIQISHTVQLRVLSAVQPLWLFQANPRYYNLHALTNDKSPIANILVASASK